METERRKNLKERFKLSGKKWKAKVVNIVVEGNKGFEVITHFDSDKHDIEQILHKIELDLYTNLEFGFKIPISVVIEEV